jgi:hypothetical protein
MCMCMYMVGGAGACPGIGGGGGGTPGIIIPAGYPPIDGGGGTDMGAMGCIIGAAIPGCWRYWGNAVAAIGIMGIGIAIPYPAAAIAAICWL